MKREICCKYCGKPYKYMAWLRRHEWRHWWNEVATEQEKQILRDNHKRWESIVLFGVNKKPNVCGGIGNYISTIGG